MLDTFLRHFNPFNPNIEILTLLVIDQYNARLLIDCSPLFSLRMPSCSTMYLHCKKILQADLFGNTCKCRPYPFRLKL